MGLLLSCAKGEVEDLSVKRIINGGAILGTMAGGFSLKRRQVLSPLRLHGPIMVK